MPGSPFPPALHCCLASGCLIPRTPNPIAGALLPAVTSPTRALLGLAVVAMGGTILL